MSVYDLGSRAIISEDGNYRYMLLREWDQEKEKILFVGLNPSTADAIVNDPTIRRCMGYTKDRGYGGMYMCNLFAYRATKPADMKSVDDPFGVDNDKHIEKYISDADIVICMWGNHGSYKGASKNFIKKYPGKLYCLEKNLSGEPKHLLYSKKNLKPIPL